MNPPRLLPTAKVYVFEGIEPWRDLDTWLSGFDELPTVLAIGCQYEDDSGLVLTIAIEEV